MKRVVLILLIMAAGGMLLSCDDQEALEISPKQSREAAPRLQQQGGIYRVPLQNSPTTLDPAYVQDAYGVYVTQQIFDGLVRFDRHLMVVPALASSWRVEEQGRVYRFFLNPDATFHDGKPVRVSDVIYSLERLLRVSPPSVLLPHLLKIEGAREFRTGSVERVQGLSVEDDNTTLVVRLIEAHTPFLTALGMHQAKIVPERVVVSRGPAFGQHPIGSGPFEFVEWVSNDLIRLRRYSGYYDTPAFLDEVHYRIYPGGEIQKILEDFQNGHLEEMPVYGGIKQELMDFPGLQLLHRPSLSLLFYGIRVNSAPLDRPELREAMSLAIDREALVKDVYKGMFEPAATILPPGMPGYTPPENTRQERMDTARKLVKRVEAELGDIPPLEIVSATKSAFSEAELDVVSQSLRAIGLEVRKKFITNWAEFENYLRSDQVQVFRYVWTADMPDPDNFMAPLFSSDSSVNFTHYRSQELDALIEQARGLTDPVERGALYQQMESMILKDHPLVPLFYLSADRAFQPSVRGAFLTPLGWQDLRLAQVWIE